MTRILATAILFCAFLAAPVLADKSAHLAVAMQKLRDGNWSEAAESARKSGSIAHDIIEWHRLRAGRGTAADVNAFLERNPDWPGLAWLRRKSETSIAAAGQNMAFNFFSRFEPQTAEGVLAYAEALIARGRKGDGETAIVLAWRTMPMGSAIQAAYLQKHKKLLSPHHTARLDRLLWDNHLVSSRRMLPLVTKGQRALAEARIALHDLARGVDNKIAAVPKDLRNSSGLAHARFVWRDRKGRKADAVQLLLERSSSAETLGEPGNWARRRLDLARRLMRDGDPGLAYNIAASHHTTPDVGYVYADLEWLSGFLALRKLNNPQTALEHFQRFESAIQSPISKGRAGYWMGRTYEALGNTQAAAESYKMGAQHQTSFYGLLAAERAGIPFDSSLKTPPKLPSWRKADFMKSSVLEAGLLLLSVGELNLAERFLTHLVESLDPQQAAQLGKMAVDMRQPHLAVMIAKRAARNAVVLHGSYYPEHPVSKLKLPMAPEMTLAIARRESEFDPVVVSGAGARGLMQVMPKTARSVAKDLGILSAHNTNRLTSDWEYNAVLGSNYLSALASMLNGNVVMMSAGYNAGPGRPVRWMKQFGDPRRQNPVDDSEIVDWIEHIPFNETRNYVMRVTESLPVYRARLGQDPLPIPFSHELTGSTLLSFAPQSE